MMSTKEFNDTQSALIRLGLGASGLDLEGFLKKLALVEAVAPDASPTLYKLANKQMESVTALALAARDLKVAFAGMRVTAIQILATDATKEMPRIVPPPPEGPM